MANIIIPIINVAIAGLVIYLAWAAGALPI